MTFIVKLATTCAVWLKRFCTRVSRLCAPRKANVDKPANPARTKPNQQFGTEPGTRGGNETCEALGKECVSHNASEGIEPRKRHNNAVGQGLQFPETNIGMCAKGECMTGLPGSKSVAGKRTVYIGTWENRNAPYRSRQEAEKATRRYGVPVVGPIHIRGVAGVMPGERTKPHSKGSAV